MTDRQTGKTTRLIEEIVAALEADPDLRVIITGAHVVAQEWYYRKLLHERGADLQRVEIIPPPRLGRGTMGRRHVKMFCDDFFDLNKQDQRSVADAERNLS